MNYSKSENRRIIFLLFIIPFLVGTGVDLYVPSLPTIVKYFQVNNNLVQLTISFYMLGYGLGQIFWGVLSDSIGRKKVLLSSTVFYIIISFLSAYAPNIFILILYRFIQGLCISGMGTLCRAIATDCFSDISLTKAMTFISISFALGPILGPFIGGYLQHYFNWQADFYYFSLYGLFILIFAAKAFPETNHHLHSFNASQIFKNIKIVIIHPVFLCITILASLIYSMLVMFNVIGPFIIQVALKYSVIDYGHIALVLGFGYFIGNLCNRWLVNYLQPMKIALSALIGSLLVVLSMICLGLFIKLNIYIIIPPILFLFYLFGLIFPNMMAKAASFFPKIAGTASAIFGTILGGSVFLVTFFASLLKTNSQMPMLIVYVVALLACLILFILFNFLNRNKEA